MMIHISLSEDLATLLGSSSEAVSPAGALREARVAGTNLATWTRYAHRRQCYSRPPPAFWAATSQNVGGRLPVH